MEATLTAPRPEVATAATLMTAEELLCLPQRGQRYELILGELKQMSPAAP